MCCKQVDIVKVKGKRQEIAVYEILALREEATEKQLQLENISLALLDAIYNGNIEKAEQLIIDHGDLVKDDFSLSLMKKLINFYKKYPKEFQKVTIFKSEYTTSYTDILKLGKPNQDTGEMQQ